MAFAHYSSAGKMKPLTNASTNPLRVQWADKFASIPGLFITSAIINTLLALHATRWHSSETFAIYVRLNPSQVAIIVQVISHLLGLIQVQVLCAMIRCTFVDSINTRTFSLHTIQWVQAASTPRLSFSLPWYLSLSLAIPVITSLIPAAIWSGSITPLIGVKNVTQLIPISTFESTNASALFTVPPDLVNSGSGSSVQVVNRNGLFSFDPSALKGTIELSAAYASNTGTTSSLHAKIDKTTYQYRGRSYGAGAAVGLVNLPMTESLWYRYEELALASEITCSKNSSMEFITELQTTWPITVLSTSGSGPTGELIYGGYYGMWMMHDYFAWGVSVNVSSNFSAYISMATATGPDDDPWLFADFNETQCRIDFTPRIFDVTVNTTSNVITAVPKDETRPEWPDYADTVLNQVLGWLSGFSTADTGFGGSSLGRSLRVNVNQLKASTGDDSLETVLRGTEDYIESMIDNTLVALASGRTMIWNSTTEVEALTGVAAATLGSRFYVIVMFVFNSVLCVMYLIEAVRTQYWKNMSSFDLMNFGAVIIGSLKGGIGLATNSPNTSDAQTHRTSSISSTQRDFGTDGMRMRLRQDDSVYPILAPAEGFNDEPSMNTLSMFPKSAYTSYTPADSHGSFSSKAD